MATNKRLIKSNDEAAGGASFNTVLYTGDGQFANDSQNVTGVGFQPDLVWVKDRGAGSNFIQDVVRGQYTTPNDYKTLITNSTASEAVTNESWHSQYGGINSFNVDGFTAKIGTNVIDSDFNVNGNDYVAWCWKAGGAAVTNTDGTITSQVSANTEAGFSIVSLTIPNANTQSVGHGLDTAPSVIIMKSRDANGAWLTYHSSVGLNKYLFLNTTSGEASYTGIWSDVNSSTFTTVYHDAIGSPTRDVIAYCFAEVAGFSKFGSHTTAAKITTGFEPAWVMIKYTGTTSDWWIMDLERWDGVSYGSNGGKLIKPYLDANTSDAEGSVGSGSIEVMSDGFYPTNFFNAGGAIHMAFANQF